MMLHDSISDLIGRIYAGARDSAAWDEVIADLIFFTRSSSALIAPTDLDNRKLFEVRYYGRDDAQLLDGVRDYIDHFHQHDPVLAYGARNPHSGVASLSAALTPAEQAQSDYVRWLTSVFELRDVITRYTPPQRGLSLAICLNPARGREAHDEADLRLFAILFPHMSEAVRLAHRPIAIADSDEPLILIDARGRVHDLSPTAAQLLSEADGLFMEGGYLRASHRGEQPRIDDTLKSALTAMERGGAGGNLALSRPSGRRPLLIRISPLPAPSSPLEALSPTALVSVVDPETPPSASAAARWTTLFGLTKAEARLAVALLTGEGNLRATADTLGIAYATARVQLASLFAKTGTHSQPQLSRLLSRTG